MALKKAAAKKAAPKKPAARKAEGKKPGNKKNSEAEALEFVIGLFSDSWAKPATVYAEMDHVSGAFGCPVKIRVTGRGLNNYDAAAAAFNALDAAKRTFVHKDKIEVLEMQLHEHLAGNPDRILSEDQLVELQAKIQKLKDTRP